MVLFYHLTFCSFHTSHKVSFHSLNESTSLSSVLSGFCANVFSQKANLAPSLPKLHSTRLLCFISDNPGALQNILFTSYSLLLSPECNLHESKDYVDCVFLWNGRAEKRKGISENDTSTLFSVSSSSRIHVHIISRLAALGDMLDR